jgi:hypothetical protein
VPRYTYEKKTDRHSSLGAFSQDNESRPRRLDLHQVHEARRIPLCINSRWSPPLLSNPHLDHLNVRAQRIGHIQPLRGGVSRPRLSAPLVCALQSAISTSPHQRGATVTKLLKISRHGTKSVTQRIVLFDRECKVRSPESSVILPPLPSPGFPSADPNSPFCSPSSILTRVAQEPRA